MKVHSTLGPGLLESAYEMCLIRELRKRELRVEAQVFIPVQYDGDVLDAGSIEKVPPIHKAQLLSYLRLSGRQVGLLINFNVEHLRDGISRVINSRPKISAYSVASAL